MEKIFKTLSKNEKVDLISYVKKYVSEHKDIQILVGCDSQNCKRDTIYAVVVALYTPQKGAHVLYNKIITPRVSIQETSVRLLNEVWFSVEIAELIKTQSGIVATWIDIDLNPDPKYGSNKALSNAVGIVTGMGYKVRHKGLSPVMTYAADKLVK